MVRRDSQALQVKWQIVLKKIKQVTIRKEKIGLWRRITRTLKDLYVNDKDIVYNRTHNTLPMDGNVGMNTARCESQPNPGGQGEVVPVSDREPAPEVVRVLIPTLVWPLVPGT